MNASHPRMAALLDRFHDDYLKALAALYSSPEGVEALVARLGGLWQTGLSGDVKARLAQFLSRSPHGHR